MARNIKRNTPITESTVKELTDTLTPFEKEVYLRVIEAGVNAIHLQFPLSKAFNQPLLYENHIRGVLCIAGIAVDQLRKMGVDSDGE